MTNAKNAGRDKTFQIRIPHRVSEINMQRQIQTVRFAFSGTDENTRNWPFNTVRRREGSNVCSQSVWRIPKRNDKPIFTNFSVLCRQIHSSFCYYYLICVEKAKHNLCNILTNSRLLYLFCWGTGRQHLLLQSTGCLIIRESNVPNLNSWFKKVY